MKRSPFAVLFLLGAFAPWSGAAVLAEEPASARKPPSAEASASLADFYAAPGPFEVETSLEDWRDNLRNRDLPVKLYLPAGEAAANAGPLPVALFSHGLGGSREAAAYLGEHWASHGYACVFLQHPGSDTPTIKGNMEAGEEFMPAMRREASAMNMMQRASDVRFALDELERLNAAGSGSPLEGKLDLSRVAMSGHSFGSVTTLNVIGQRFVTPRGREMGRTEERIKAAVILSPPPPRGGSAPSYDKVAIPCLQMTGTLDVTPLDAPGAKASDRRAAFEQIHRADQYIITFEGGDHMIFSGRRLKSGPREKDEDFHRLINQSSTAFLDATLRGDARAKAWLDDQEAGFAKTLGADGVFEAKPGDE
jgi:predicted dienelactone hydrolase